VREETCSGDLRKPDLTQSTYTRNLLPHTARDEIASATDEICLHIRIYYNIHTLVVNAVATTTYTVATSPTTTIFAADATGTHAVGTIAVRRRYESLSLSLRLFHRPYRAQPLLRARVPLWSVHSDALDVLLCVYIHAHASVCAYTYYVI